MKTFSPNAHNAAADAFTEEWARQLAELPGYQQAEVLTAPGGLRARELAARAVLAMEEKGVRV